MKTIKGPGIYLAQFAADEAPYNSLPGSLRMGRCQRLRRRSNTDMG